MLIYESEPIRIRMVCYDQTVIATQHYAAICRNVVSIYSSFEIMKIMISSIVGVKYSMCNGDLCWPLNAHAT